MDGVIFTGAAGEKMCDLPPSSRPICARFSPRLEFCGDEGAALFDFLQVVLEDALARVPQAPLRRRGTVELAFSLAPRHATDAQLLEYFQVCLSSS